MQTEIQALPHERYLYANECFSDKAISIWKSECLTRCRDKVKGEGYQRFLDWKRAENEIAVFTLYAYADFAIPKKMDVIFRGDDPAQYLQTDFILTQSIYEAWYPTDQISHGHKHLCIFSFQKELPEFLLAMHVNNEKYSTAESGHPYFGFCNATDFPMIKKEITRINSLKERYGNRWWDYDND